MFGMRAKRRSRFTASKGVQKTMSNVAHAAKAPLVLGSVAAAALAGLVAGFSKMSMGRRRHASARVMAARTRSAPRKTKRHRSK